MARPPITIIIHALLVCSMILITATGLAEGGYRIAAEVRSERPVGTVGNCRDAMESGDAAMKGKDYEKAAAYYGRACDLAADAALRSHALKQFCDASVKLAEQRITEGRYSDAQSILTTVLDDRYDPRCKPARIILGRLQQPDYYNKTIGPKSSANAGQVKQWFIEAQGYFDSGRYALAKKRCEQILNIDPYNIAAREFEEKIDRASDDYGIAADHQKSADAISSVDGSHFGGPHDTLPVTRVDHEDPRVAALRLKMDRLIIPKLEFRETTLREAIDFLKRKSVDLDASSPAGEKGVNIVLKLEGAGGAAGASGAAEGNPLDTRITVSLTNIPLIEALKYVTGLANLKFRVEPYAVAVVPLSDSNDVLVTKEWKIPPDLILRPKGATDPIGGNGTVEATKAGAGVADRESAKNWLIANGVVFNGAASAIYIVRSSRLIVRNTQDQVDLVDTIISSGQPHSGPVQVEIECKLIEAQQDDLKELSLDSLSGQFNSPATQNVFRSGSNVGTSPTKAIEQLLSPVAGASSLVPASGAISGVFTDPQFQLIMRAIKDKKGVEILSSPKLTVKSGQRAVFEVFRGFRAPTEDTPPQIPRASAAAMEIPAAGDGTASADADAVTPTSPASSEERDLGITLEVKATVGPDGYTIDLDLAPQVVEFDGFVSPGSPFIWTMKDPLTGISQQNIITPNLHNQPIFSTRKVTSSVSVFDGSSVVLSDVAKGENMESIIGDVPAIGQAPRSDLDRHVRRNFLLFVSASLVNASSGPVRTGDEKEELVETIAPPETAPLELPLMPK